VTAGRDADDETRSAPSSDPAADVGAFIRQQREVARMSIRKLADVAGVSNPYLSQIERGLRRPSAEILQQVADALRISVESLYVRAGLLRDDGERSSGVLEAIEHDPVLSTDQKRALADVYRSFVETRRSEQSAR
jgi:transcriptional regulator with XRE-family HTH domain